MEARSSGSSSEEEEASVSSLSGGFGGSLALGGAFVDGGVAFDKLVEEPVFGGVGALDR